MIDFDYRDTNYFNDNEYYIIETNLNKLFVSKLHHYNGGWYTNEGMQYKATSVRMVKAKDGLHRKRVWCKDDKNNEGTGLISQFMSPFDIGINWGQGSKINPQYWVNINDKDLKLL